MNPFISVWKKVDRHPRGYDLQHYFWELIQWDSFLNTHMEQKYSHILSPFRITQPSLKPCYQSGNLILSKCLDLASWDKVLKILPIGKLSHSPLTFKVILEWVWNGTAIHFSLPSSIRPDFPPQPSDHKDSLWVLGLQCGRNNYAEGENNLHLKYLLKPNSVYITSPWWWTTAGPLWLYGLENQTTSTSW